MFSYTVYSYLFLLFFGGFSIVAAYLLYKNFLYGWIFAFMMMPLSLTLKAVFGAAITIPSDFLAIILMVFVIVKSIDLYKDYVKIIEHPVAFLLLSFIGWGFITSIFSTDIVVSIKRVLNYSWYILGFFFFSVLVFKRDRNYFVYLMKVTSFPVIFVSLYLIVRMGMTGFDLEHIVNKVYQPFYKDHTIYGASIAFFVVTYLGLALDKKQTKSLRLLFAGTGLLAFIAVILSLTRGAWLGLLASLFFIGLVKLWEINKKLTVAILIGFLFVVGFQINNVILHLQHKIQKTNREGIMDRFVSMADVENDPSNLERFNRWVAALRMTLDKPLFGFGPGTYEKNYAPYQMSRFITIISTNRGDVGSAHNEILLASSETGIPGGLIVFALFIISVLKATKGYFSTEDNQLKLLYLIILGNIITYYTHAIVNNFMDQDKVAIPLFTILGLLVALDLYYNKKQNKDALQRT